MPQLDFTTYSSELKWIVLAVSVGYLLFRFVLAAPTWTMTRLQTNDRTNLWNGASFLPLLVSNVNFTATLFRIIGLCTFVMYRITKRMVELWQVSKGWRLDAAKTLFFEFWLRWLSYERCLVYLVINVTTSIYFAPVYCLAVLPTLLFFIGGTVGYFVYWYASKRYRKPWLLGFPAVFLAVVLPNVYSLIHYTLLIPFEVLPQKLFGFSVVYCILDGAADGSTPTDITAKPQTTPGAQFKQAGLASLAGKTILNFTGTTELAHVMAGKLGTTAQTITAAIGGVAGAYMIARHFKAASGAGSTLRVFLKGPTSPAVKLVEHPSGNGRLLKTMIPGDRPLFEPVSTDPTNQSKHQRIAALKGRVAFMILMKRMIIHIRPIATRIIKGPSLLPQVGLSGQFLPEALFVN